MLSDDSSSDSETGRFKGHSQNQDEQKSNKREDSFRSSARNRHSDMNDRFKRDIDRRRDERIHIDRHSRDRHRYSKQSPPRRRYSREKSPYRKSHDHYRHHTHSRGRSKPRDRSNSKDKLLKSRSRSNRTPDRKSDQRDVVKTSIVPKRKSHEKDKIDKKSLSPEYVKNKSAVHKATPPKKKSNSPIVIDEHIASDVSEEVQPGSYYSMIPAVVKDKSEESSEIDSSDDEKLRAKLLNLEKELQKTKKRKHKKKHKRKKSKSIEKDSGTPTIVEVTSTTDIEDKLKNDLTKKQSEIITEVTSTQKSSQKESCEEGEISSDDSQSNIKIDPTDLRHKLRQTAKKRDSSQETSKIDICGPALPPHLEQKQLFSHEFEGPALPPHLQSKPHIGPGIPDDMRRVLAENESDEIKYVSSEDEGIGPLPMGSEDKWSEAHQQLEERALDMKIKKLDGHSLHSKDVKSREQWMLELPEAKAKFIGLEARTFRAKEGPDMSDRSSWTDTPEEKVRKAAGVVKEEDARLILQREAQARVLSRRDHEQEAAVKKHKKKHRRDESLLELHEKKMKKKKKKEEKEDGPKERRPFSRDEDLQVNRFDEAQKKSIIKKAQNLDSRFSRGEAKFL